MFMFCFFFSSRRRHTRLQGDWSSDVCSSDLMQNDNEAIVLLSARALSSTASATKAARRSRSEERRVGKECRCGWWAGRYKKKRRDEKETRGEERESRRE